METNVIIDMYYNHFTSLINYALLYWYYVWLRVRKVLSSRSQISWQSMPGCRLPILWTWNVSAAFSESRVWGVITLSISQPFWQLTISCTCSYTDIRHQAYILRIQEIVVKNVDFNFWRFILQYYNAVKTIYRNTKRIDQWIKHFQWVLSRTSLCRGRSCNMG